MATITKNSELDIISLMNLGISHSAVIVSITAGPKSAKRLADLGLTPNTPIMVIRKAPFHGPIEIKVRGSNLILGRGIAAKILVKKP